MHPTLPRLINSDFPAIRRRSLSTLQVNLGYKCNQSCLHCHVNAGPSRKEMMDDETVDLLDQVIAKRKVQTLDVTGGAPEMHPRFRDVVLRARAHGTKVIDRCNLTILMEPGYESTAEFLAENDVEITASLPCYSAKNVDQQRGDGVFDASIAALQKLNDLGYGKPDTGLTLNLVYNPQGPSLPPPQEALEADYKRELKKHFGIEFNQLFALTNMPIKRFGSTLISKGTFDIYVQLLKDNYLAANLDSVMCRDLVSVDYQGNIFDCDFNQMLAIPADGERPNLRDLLHDDWTDRPIKVADHCYGCTAGQGSSCGGALKEDAA